MKLPIQAHPINRKSNSAKISKKATGAIGTSELGECTNKTKCDWALASCALAISTTGPLGGLACLIELGAEECAACLPHVSTKMPGGGGSRPERPWM